MPETALQVLKFGGSALAEPARVQNVAAILKQEVNGPAAVVVSAMAKTTNALDELAHLAMGGSRPKAEQQFNEIAAFHRGMLEALIPDRSHAAYGFVNQFLDELRHILEGILLLGDVPRRLHDRILSYGELLSSSIVAQYLIDNGFQVKWLDARDVICTDARFGSANVLWNQTVGRIQEETTGALNQNRIVLTQGFIARTTDGHTTTLGREGSDYTGAIFAHALNAVRYSIWKDVPGVMSGDPREFPDAFLLEALSYEQAVEMTFYGASVIHPKTLKPLQNKGIPLYVRSFLAPEKPGTVIQAAEAGVTDIPATILKKDRALVTVRSKAFAFMDPVHVREVVGLAERLGLEVNLLQTTAIALKLCVKHDPERVNSFSAQVSEAFWVEVEKGLTLKTVLHQRHTYVEIPKNAVLVQADSSRLNLVLQA